MLFALKIEQRMTRGRLCFYYARDNNSDLVAALRTLTKRATLMRRDFDPIRTLGIELLFVDEHGLPVVAHD